MKLEDKTATLTGSARGLGRACALRLAALGADVAIVDLNLDGGAQFSERPSAPSVAKEIERVGRRGLGIRANCLARC